MISTANDAVNWTREKCNNTADCKFPSINLNLIILQFTTRVNKNEFLLF